MKYVPNVLTISRIILSVISILNLDNRLSLIIILIICGITDLIDGTIARKTKNSTNLGAMLDSIADLFMFIAVIVGVIILANSRIMPFLPYIAIIAIIRITSIIVAGLRYHRLAMIHTWANKITGVSIFLAFVVFVITDSMIVFISVCIIAAISAIEELAINITSNKVNLNRRSIFMKE